MKCIIDNIDNNDRILMNALSNKNNIKFIEDIPFVLVNKLYEDYIDTFLDIDLEDSDAWINDNKLYLNAIDSLAERETIVRLIKEHFGKSCLNKINDEEYSFNDNAMLRKIIKHAEYKIGIYNLLEITYDDIDNYNGSWFKTWIEEEYKA